MSAANWFWIIYVICVLFGGFWSWRPQGRPFAPYYAVMVILVGLLGWGVFGPPLR